MLLVDKEADIIVQFSELLNGGELLKGNCSGCKVTLRAEIDDHVFACPLLAHNLITLDLAVLRLEICQNRACNHFLELLICQIAIELQREKVLVSCYKQGRLIYVHINGDIFGILIVKVYPEPANISVRLCCCCFVVPLKKGFILRLSRFLLLFKEFFGSVKAIVESMRGGLIIRGAVGRDHGDIKLGKHFLYIIFVCQILHYSLFDSQDLGSEYA